MCECAAPIFVSHYPVTPSSVGLRCDCECPSMYVSGRCLIGGAVSAAC